MQSGKDDDYFAILGIQPTASMEQIKARFDLLQHAFQPEKFPSGALRKDAEKYLARVKAAYDALSKLEKQRESLPPRLGVRDQAVSVRPNRYEQSNGTGAPKIPTWPLLKTYKSLSFWGVKWLAFQNMGSWQSFREQMGELRFVSGSLMKEASVFVELACAANLREMGWAAGSKPSDKEFEVQFVRPILEDFSSVVTVCFTSLGTTLHFNIKQKLTRWWRWESIKRRLQWRWIGAAVWACYSLSVAQTAKNYDGGLYILSFVSLVVFALIGYINARIDYGKYYGKHTWTLTQMADMVIPRMWGPMVFLFLSYMASREDNVIGWGFMYVWFLGHWLIGSFRPVSMHPRLETDLRTYSFAKEIDLQLHSVTNVLAQMFQRNVSM